MTVYNRENYITNDTPIKKDLLKLFKNIDKLTILDIGGCEGEESIRYSRIFPFSSIFLFEPLPKNQKLVLENIKKYKSETIKLVPMAVSDEDGSTEFYVSSGHPDPNAEFDWDFGNKSSSLLAPQVNNNPSWLQFNEKIQVKTIRLDTFLMENKIIEVDFVHMDVQGAELKVLSGAKGFVKNIKAIWLEVADVEIYKGQPLRRDVEVFMKANGFYLIKSKMQGSSGDQFYLNSRYFKTFSIWSKRLQFHIKKRIPILHQGI
ncbi:FkbM family methyltransferase [Flavobacterium yafengii]|uniref:FkbM family methyltransferase n=1 Tax=Flavobacterium yafengii TaxID=3041253 RepID=UPI0024A965A3|nr:FkbM family methyltransferase [Flavobacterium yafengii]MDI6046613.1 FkbM family methyltransferase [Flavobacterium yafengii]